MKPRLTQAKPAFVSRSKETGTSYTVYVDAPRSRGPHPVALLMDGDFLFDAGVHAARALAAAGKIPPTIVAAVGYGASFGEPGNYRGRDYTPTAAAEEPLSGGADRFLSYLCGSLWPEIASRYPVRDKDRLIAGHSLGSLVVLHSLFQEEPFFDLALAGAPSIWWDDRSILKLAAKLRDRQEGLEARLYLGVGDSDSPSMLGDLELLEKQLRDRPFKGLGVTSGTFPGLDHYNSAAAILAAGLTDLLG